ncbi:hypothetical protein V7S43_013728 [Phytophthora oleae]|uniref:Uncharacterized protein n=1 Tax=Phytophthora oleae TaxID=2107226 RepID=A0ABD3F6J4_9STRA
MTPPLDVETAGMTTFQSPPSSSYRYILQLNGDKLSFWVEDRTSKKQWRKGDLVRDNYVTSANMIADASALDYLKCFKEALDCELDKSRDIQRINWNLYMMAS